MKPGTCFGGRRNRKIDEVQILLSRLVITHVRSLPMIDWDRTHDWELQRIRRDLTRVVIRFRHVPPSVDELVAIRRALPKFCNLSPGDVRAAIGQVGELELGVLPSPEARQIIEVVQRQGLDAIAADASSVGYLPLDRTIGCALLIEDAAESTATVQAMLAAGVPIRDVEAKPRDRLGDTHSLND